MKKIYLLVIAAVLMLANVNTIFADDSLNKVKSSGKLILGLDDTFPPMGFRSSNGEIVGFDIDLAKEVAKRMGVELVIKPVEWSTVILSLNKGDIDMIWNGMTVTPERAKQINFSSVYLKNRLVVVVPQGSRVKSMSDLAGKIVGVQLGSSNEAALTKSAIGKKIKNIRKYDVNAAALVDLKAKRVDAVALDEIVARYYISSNNENFIVLNEEITNEDYAVGFRKKDKALLNEVNRILAEMKKDGTAAKISQKWFNEDLIALK